MLHHNPFGGIGYLLHGFSLLTKPGLKRFVVIPLLLNILLFSFLISLGSHFVAVFIDHYVYLVPEWLRWLRWLMWIILFFVSAMIVVYYFTIVANLISAPFNGLLSEKVEEILTGKKPTESSLKDTIKDMPRALKREWCKIKYYLPRAIFLIVLFFIPAVSLIASILWFVFSCWMMAVEYVDFPMDNRKMVFAELPRYLRKHCLTSLGFGFAVVIASLIPIVNFTVMPAAVIGGTCMWLDKEGKLVSKG
jgi:CysZ protein